MAFHPAPIVFAPFGFILLVLITGAIGYIGIKRARNGRTDRSENEADQALETLRQRYATGEIDNEEFQERKEQLVRY